MESRKSTREQHHGEPWSYSCGFTASFVWPPRSYPCSFCKREFRSAQALGGHMNVHRRDRARLRQCSPPTPANPNPTTTTTTTITIPNLNYPPPPPHYCPNHGNISHGHDGSSTLSSLAVAAARARLEVNLELGVGVCCSTAGVMEDGLDLELRLGCS